MTEPSHLTRTRAAYDTVAADYADLLRTALDAQPLDRALLATFAELVRGRSPGRVVDLGCGPGRLTGFLADLGLDVSGIDLSPSMVDVARRSHPHLRFEVGSMADLDAANGSLAGVVAWYSMIHTPPDRLPDVLRELHRVLAPGGQLLVAFQAGDERVRLAHAYGHRVDLDAYRMPPDRVARLLDATGLAVHTRVLREPTGRERTPQAYLFASRPSA